MKKKKSCHEIQSYEKKLYFSSLFRLMFRTNFSQNLKGGKTSFWKCICYLIFLSACLLRSFFLWRGGGGGEEGEEEGSSCTGCFHKTKFQPSQYWRTTRATPHSDGGQKLLSVPTGPFFWSSSRTNTPFNPCPISLN